MESLRKLIEDGVKSGNLSCLEEVGGDPGFSGMLHAYVHAFPEDVRDEHLCTLLERAHRGCKFVDLSPFCNLSLDNVVSIVNGLSKGQNQNLCLTLLDRKHVTVLGLQQLVAIGSIVELYLGAHGTIDLKDVVKAIDGTSITGLATPELYSRKFVSSDDTN